MGAVGVNFGGASGVASPFFLIALVIMSGCTSPLTDPAQSLQSEGSTRPLVVALLDEGINPYHETFSRTDRPRVDGLAKEIRDALTGLPPVPVRLSDGTELRSLFQEDGALWDSLEHRTLYAFEGTNVLGISFYEWEKNRVLLYDEDLGHGTGVASVVTNMSPSVILVMIEISASFCGAEGPCVIDPNMVRAMEWAAAQPWIDVISMSASLRMNLPDPTTLDFARATRAAVSSGKVVLNSAGNYPSVSLADDFAGPPWVIAVGGALNATRGSIVLSSKTPDVVADYFARVARGDRVSGSQEAVGTSYSAPRVAGVAANVVRAVRSAWGHEGGISDGALAVSPDGKRLLPGDLRRALNASATYWATSEWAPANNPSNDTLNRLAVATVPILPGAPFTQMGWGFVDEATTGEIVRRALAADLEPPPEKSAAAGYMATQSVARENYWRAALGE